MYSPLNPAIATSVLQTLRAELGVEGLEYRAEPVLIQDGGENTIARLSLRGGPPDLAEPLVLRCYPPERDPGGVRFEAALHHGVLAQGYPAPRVHAAVDRRGVWGGAFMLMDRLPGRTPLHEVGDLGRVLGSPWTALRTLPRLVWQASRAVPDLLGEWMARLHAIEASPIVAAVEAADLDPCDYTALGRLESLEGRADAAGLTGLAANLEWLRMHHREPEHPVLCHGDFQFLNILTDAGRTTGVIDWSTQHCTFDDLSFDVGNTTALLALRLPGLPAPVVRVFEPIQRRMAQRFLDAYRAHAGRVPDPDRILWAEVFRYVREMVMAGELLRGGHCARSTTLRPDENPWAIPELRRWVLGAIAARTGIAASLPEPD